MKRLLSVFCLASLVLGCTTGVTVVLKDSSGVNVGSISFQESTWPIVSYFTGPIFRFWAREDFDGKMWVKGSASLTNTTSACGIYESTERKDLEIDMFYNMKTNEVAITPWSTNNCCTATKGAAQ